MELFDISNENKEGSCGSLFAEYGWSDSDSNFSAKLSDQTLRYREVLELADVLGYEIVWQKRRED